MLNNSNKYYFSDIRIWKNCTHFIKTNISENLGGMGKSPSRLLCSSVPGHVVVFSPSTRIRTHITNLPLVGLWQRLISLITWLDVFLAWKQVTSCCYCFKSISNVPTPLRNHWLNWLELIKHVFYCLFFLITWLKNFPFYALSNHNFLHR